MFDIGFGELLLVALLTLIVVGPERMPTVARVAGRALGKLRRIWSLTQEDVSKKLQAISDQNDSK